MIEMQGLRISEAGLTLIKIHEGLRLDAYLDSAGVPTIGYGHTGDVQLGDRITEDRAEDLLRADVDSAEAAIRRRVKVQLRQREYDALTSWTFNLGEGSLRESTLLERLNRGDKLGAAAEFLKWHYAGGRAVLGLLLRRWREAGMWLGTYDPLEGA